MESIKKEANAEEPVEIKQKLDISSAIALQVTEESEPPEISPCVNRIVLLLIIAIILAQYSMFIRVANDPQSRALTHVTTKAKKIVII